MCGHSGALVMVLRLQPRAGGQAAFALCRKSGESGDGNGGGGLKSGALSSLDWPTAGGESVAQPPPSPCHRDLDSLAINLDETRCRWSQIHDTDERGNRVGNGSQRSVGPWQEKLRVGWFPASGVGNLLLVTPGRSGEGLEV